MRAWLIWPGAILAVLTGAAAGWLNGVLIARLNIPSIILTLATLFLWRGVAVVLAGGLSYNLRGVRDTALWQVTTGRLFDWLPLQALWVVLIAVGLVVHPQPPPLRRGAALPRRQCRGGPRHGHRRGH